MIWNDERIAAWAASGGVTPFDKSCVNPASLDLRLGNRIRLTRRKWLMHNDAKVNRHTPASELWQDEFEFEKYRLSPGEFVLCHSLEFTRIPDTSIATLYSKSSTGRIGLEHLHAGYGDCGFVGEWTWEFFNAAPWPIELIAGERVMQLVFMDMCAKPSRTYQETGRYQNQTGPTAAR
jgi:deoxycytidine triphosphate deaminase